MSTQTGMHHPPIRSHRDAYREQIRSVLSTYGALPERRLLELLCPGRDADPAVRAALTQAERAGVVRRVGDVYALAHPHETKRAPG